jgi:hypothetical protein
MPPSTVDAAAASAVPSPGAHGVAVVDGTPSLHYTARQLVIGDDWNEYACPLTSETSRLV